MRTWIKFSLSALGALVAGAVAVAAYGAWNAERKLHRQVALPPSVFALRGAAGALERGHYLYESRGCASCHGSDGGGRVFIDDGHGMRIKAPDIATGAGSVVAGYRDADFDRTIRHGVKRDGRPVFIMPSEDYSRLTDDDLEALVTYVRQLPPTSGGPLEASVPLPVRVLYGLGLVRDAADKIDHALPPPAPVANVVSAAHGHYVAQMCIGCHGPGLSGGKIPGTPPDWPPAANLTPGEGSAMPRYADAAAFATMLRSGRRPDGSEISKVMPFEALKNLDDVDALSIHAYLKTVEAKAAGGR